MKKLGPSDGLTVSPDVLRDCDQYLQLLSIHLTFINFNFLAVADKVVHDEGVDLFHIAEDAQFYLLPADLLGQTVIDLEDRQGLVFVHLDVGG